MRKIKSKKIILFIFILILILLSIITIIFVAHRAIQTNSSSEGEADLSTAVSATITEATQSFNPSNLGGLKVWYDASTIKAADKSLLAGLENKAMLGAEFNAVQNDSANQPVYVKTSDVNGKPGIRMRPNDYFQIGGDEGFDLTDMTVISVMNPKTLDVKSQICSRRQLDGSDHNWYFNLEGLGATLNFGWKVQAKDSWVKPSTQPILEKQNNYTLIARKDGGNGSIFINGVNRATFSGGVTPQYNGQMIFLGTPSQFAEDDVSVDADFCEFMIFDKGLSDAEVEQVSNYLGEKWGISTPKNDLNGITVGGQKLEGFSSSTYVYNHLLPEGTTEVPAVEATSGTDGAQIQVEPAASLPGETKINVTYNGIIRTYRIMLSLKKELVNLKQPAIEDVQITDGFWKPKIDQFRTTTINHIFDNFEKTGAFTNFDKVAKGERSTQSQSVATDPWNDGLIYETIRGTSDYLRQKSDPALEKKIDGYIDRIYAAAMTMDDGYLSTWSILDTDNKRFDEANAIWYHDSYNFGCMCEAAVHYYKATGKTKLLYVATRFAQYMVNNFGKGKINMVPSHEGPEEMLFKLYELYRVNPQLKEVTITGQNIKDLIVDETKYKKLAEFWLENRGNYEGRVKNDIYSNYGVYAQDHALYNNQMEAAGHSVRANLFYNGLAYVGSKINNASYMAAADIIWNNIVEKQQYITGGVGATNDGQEAYAGNYVIPNDGYCETCAQVAMGFFDQSMLQAFGNSQYADNLEKEIYNGILGGIGSNGKSFFYQQRLTANDYERWTWIEHTPCCPPMFSKFFSEMPAYIYSYSNDAIYANQFISSKAKMKLEDHDVKIGQTTKMPWTGDTSYKFTLTGNKAFNFNIRIPSWTDSYTIKVNGEIVEGYAVANGYAVINRTWKNGDKVDVSFAMTAKREYSNPNVSTNNGKVALTYGPLVYTVESVDNKIEGISNPLEVISLPKSSQLNTQFEAGLLGGVQTITLPGIYSDAVGVEKSLNVKAIPFYARANRGKSSTLVWVDEK